MTFSPSVGNAQPLEDGEASPAQRRLLSRLSRIGAQMLQRTPSDDATRLLDVLESAVSAPIATTREGDGVGDSGIFVEDDEEEEGYRRPDVESSSSSEEEQDDGEANEVESVRESRNGLGMRMSDSPESEVLDSPVDAGEEEDEEEEHHEVEAIRNSTEKKWKGKM